MPEPINKPTQEELKAIQEEAIKAAEELEGKERIPQDKEETPEDQPEKTPEPEEEVEEPTEEEEEQPQADPSEEAKERLKKKLSDSARENQKIYAKNRVINKALSEADDIPEPTEEELAKEFSDWDVMSDMEKTFAKETVVSRNWRKVISEAKEQATKIEKWNESVETFIDDPKTLVSNPELEGKADEFKEFALVEANNSVPFNLLVSAFLHDHATNKPSHKGRMFEKGSGGPNENPKPKDGKISLEEGRRIRETDYDKWKELNAADKIDYDL